MLDKTIRFSLHIYTWLDIGKPFFSIKQASEAFTIITSQNLSKDIMLACDLKERSIQPGELL
jgi:hypothetical protein